MSCSQDAVAVLLVALLVGVQGHQIIYVDTENGTLDNSCWEGGLDQPCGNLELATTGANRYNSTIAVVLKQGTSCTTAQTSLQDLSYPLSPTTKNDACRCNELSNTQKNDSISTQSSNASCPPWFEPSNGTCKCGKSIHDIVKCNETRQESAILQSYCMTYSELTGTVVVGACLYNGLSYILYHLKDVYRPLPKSVGQLNDAMCGDFNRSGQLCGECKTNHTPLIYSYDLQCTMCSDSQYNWIKYVAVAFVPLTAFLVLVLCCRISATSPRLYAFVTFNQVLAIPANVRVLLLLANKESPPRGSIILRILSTFYGFWNLDFFRTLIPHQICLNVDALQALAIDYSIAFYPLVLIIITYLLIELHAHNCRVIVWIWRPFHRCFARFRQQCDVRTSIIDAFATILLLSNIKLLSLSLDFLTPIYVYDMNGTVLGTYLYYAASIEYFGKKHLPYAILAVFVVVAFILFPLILLLLYPLQCFQWCLGHCRIRWHALHIFVDAFQGYYKDGTKGTQDCRYFAGVYLLMRLILFILFAVIRNGMYCAVAILALIGVAMVIARVQPYKAEFAAYNAIDSIFILALAMWYGTIVCLNIAAVKARNLVRTFIIVSFLVAAFPLLYLIVVFLCWICSRRGIGQRLFDSIKTRIGSVCRRAHGTGLEESLPDRLINLHRYLDNEDFHLADSNERFSDHTYVSINNQENVVTS